MRDTSEVVENIDMTFFLLNHFIYWASLFLLVFSREDELDIVRGLRRKSGSLERSIHLSHTNEFVSLSSFKPNTCPVDTMASASGWHYRTSLKNSDRIPLLWVSSQEGVLSHYFQAEKLWRIAVLLHHRPIVLAPFISQKHYGETIMRLCDYFIFPKDVLCSITQKNSDGIVPSSCNCKLVARSNFTSKPQYKLFNDFDYFNISKPPIGQIIDSVDFSEAQCLAGFVDMHNGFPEPPKFNIKKEWSSCN